MVRKRWGANLFTWNWRLSAVDPIHVCSKTMQNSEAAYYSLSNLPTCRPGSCSHVFRRSCHTWVWESKFFWWKMRLLIETQKKMESNHLNSDSNLNTISISSKFLHSSTIQPPSRVLSLSVWTFLTRSILGRLTPQLSPPLTWMLPWKAQEFEGF